MAVRRIEPKVEHRIYSAALRRLVMRIPVVPLVLLTILFGAPNVIAAADPTSIEDFVKLKTRWPDLVGVRVTVEGRYASIIGKAIRFENCPLVFRSEEPLPRTPRDSKTIEVTGQLAEVDGELVFQISALKPLPHDVVTFQSRRTALGRDVTSDQLYELARSALARGTFYDDETLVVAARGYYTEGMRLELQGLPSDAPKTWFTMAARADEFDLPASLAANYRHQAYQLQWQQIREDPQADISLLAKELAESLPDSLLPLRLAEPELRAKYQAEPIAVYAASPAAVRSKLHRIFYREVLLEDIRRKAAPDGRDGFETAKSIEKHLPEDFELAEQYRQDELKYRLTRVDSSTRQEALALAEEFREHKLPKLAQQTIVDWLAARRRRLQPDDIDGLLQLADEYIQLASDRQTAVEMLIAAQREQPELKTLSDRLNKLGYKLRDGEWLSEQEWSQLPEDPVRKAMKDGRVAVGMTGSQVRKTLGAASRTARTLTAGEVGEIWIYGQPGSSRIIVQLQRRVRQPELEVVRISQVDR